MDCNINRLGILVDEAHHLQIQSQERFSWGPRGWKRRICRAAMSGDWEEASSYDETHPNWFSTALTAQGDTALHVAVSMKQTNFVDKLVGRMSMEDMKIAKADGNNAFCIAAISGNVEIAAILLSKSSELVWIRGHKEMLPIELASSSDKPLMVNFLFETSRNDMHIHLSFQDIVRLFFLALTNNIYTVGSILLETHPELASTESDKGLIALEVLAQSSFDRDAPGYRDILSSLFKLMEEDEFPNSTRTSKAMFDGAKSGNDMIVESIFRYDPNMLMIVNSEGQSLLHIAILHRQVNVYQLIMSKGAYKDEMLQLVDHEGNSVLHAAGVLAAEERFGSPMLQILICSEELWFRELEKIVPPELKTMKNTNGWTPEELFYREHKKLSEKAVSELNNMANNFLVVGTLIITLGITGGLTIRTNPIEGHTPIFGQKTWFTIYALSVAFGLTFSITSLFFFTSILLPTIRKGKRGFVNSRVVRMTCGCLLLYVAVGLMGAVTATSGFVLVFNNFVPIWIYYPITALVVLLLVISFMVYDYFMQLSLHIIQSFCGQEAVIMLSRMGIKWALF